MISPKVLNYVFLFVSLPTLGAFNEFCLVDSLSWVSTSNCNLHKKKFVNHHWWCTSMYRLLSIFCRKSYIDSHVIVWYCAFYCISKRLNTNGLFLWYQNQWRAQGFAPPPEPKLRGMYYRHQEGCILNVMGVDTPSQVFKPLHNQLSHAILCKGGLLVVDLLLN